MSDLAVIRGETRPALPALAARAIVNHLTNGGRAEVAERMAGHSNAKTTGLCDRRNADISAGEAERIGIWGPGG